MPNQPVDRTAPHVSKGIEAARTRAPIASPVVLRQRIAPHVAAVIQRQSVNAPSGGVQRPAAIQRMRQGPSIARVGGYYFFGVDVNYAEDLPKDVVHAPDLGIGTNFVTMGVRAIRTRLEAVAEKMKGKKAASCSLGRERSAFAIFAALYVNDGWTKENAAEAIVGAVATAQDQKAADQTKAMISSATWFLKLPSKYEK